MRHLRAYPLFLGLLVMACAKSRPAPQPEARPAEPPPQDELEARLRRHEGAIREYMDRHGSAMRGEVAPGSPRDVSAMLRPGWCYAVLGSGGEGIKDLDLRIYDPHQVLLERDISRNDHPWLGRVRPICPVEPGQFRIEVRAARGRGAYIVQVYRSI